MAVSSCEAERRVAAMIEGLRSAGLRVTHQRVEIAREIAATDEHPDVEAVYEAVRTRVPTISLDTVYRTLAVLVDIGLAARVPVALGPARYDSNAARHHHFVCTSCGLIVDVDCAELEALIPPAFVRELGSVERAEIHFKGRCQACRASAGDIDEGERT